MATTRSKTRKVKVYRHRVKSSPCRGKKEQCRLKYGCKRTRRSATRKSYCRKTHNRSA